MAARDLTMVLQLFLCVASFFAFLATAAHGLHSICKAMDPSPALQQFVDILPLPHNIPVHSGTTLTLGAYKISQKLHRDLPKTPVYAFGTSKFTATYPGPTLVARRGFPTYINWENHIHDDTHMFTVDKTIHWAHPKCEGVPIIPHLHGSETSSFSDGHPDAWFTAKGEKGSKWFSQPFTYPNTQFPTMLWYHDHVIGITRLNVYAGLAGLYLLTWPEVERLLNLPSGRYEVPLVIQDRQFFQNGSLNFPDVGKRPGHPNWCPEVYGDTILVNGKVWPYMNVDARQYRFRILNGANARFFTLFFTPALSFLKIGTDGGYLSSPINLTTVTLGPGERADLIVDFSMFKLGSEFYLNNSARAGFPDGNLPVKGTNVVMKFVIARTESKPYQKFSSLTMLPQLLKKQYDSLADARQRYFILDSQFYINNMTWLASVTEKSRLGTVEIWNIINPTPDAHPMHVHLIQLKMLSQQAFDVNRYTNTSCSLEISYPDKRSCYLGYAKGPNSDQSGWKDTVVAWPGNVTSLVLRFSSQDGSKFQFDPSKGPGYPWHCHVLGHEDNDMMRPFMLLPFFSEGGYEDVVT